MNLKQTREEETNTKQSIALEREEKKTFSALNIRSYKKCHLFIYSNQLEQMQLPPPVSDLTFPCFLFVFSTFYSQERKQPPLSQRNAVRIYTNLISLLSKHNSEWS